MRLSRLLFGSGLVFGAAGVLLWTPDRIMIAVLTSVVAVAMFRLGFARSKRERPRGGGC